MASVKFCAMELLLTGIILPVSVSAFYLFGTRGELLQNNSLAAGFPTIIYAVFTLGIGGGIVEEFIFRGIIMRDMERNWGKTVSVIVPSFLFGPSHLADLNAWHVKDALLLLAAGTLVGIIRYYFRQALQ